MSTAFENERSRGSLTIIFFSVCKVKYGILVIENGTVESVHIIESDSPWFRIKRRAKCLLYSCIQVSAYIKQLLQFENSVYFLQIQCKGISVLKK